MIFHLFIQVGAFSVFTAVGSFTRSDRNTVSQNLFSKLFSLFSPHGTLVGDHCTEFSTRTHCVLMYIFHNRHATRTVISTWTNSFV